jgi:hypothetical protein
MAGDDERRDLDAGKRHLPSGALALTRGARRRVDHRDVTRRAPTRRVGAPGVSRRRRGSAHGEATAGRQFVNATHAARWTLPARLRAASRAATAVTRYAMPGPAGCGTRGRGSG